MVRLLHWTQLKQWSDSAAILGCFAIHPWIKPVNSMAQRPASASFRELTARQNGLCRPVYIASFYGRVINLAEKVIQIHWPRISNILFIQCPASSSLAGSIPGSSVLLSVVAENAGDRCNPFPVLYSICFLECWCAGLPIQMYRLRTAQQHHI